MKTRFPVADKKHFRLIVTFYALRDMMAGIGMQTPRRNILSIDSFTRPQLQIFGRMKAALAKLGLVQAGTNPFQWYAEKPFLIGPYAQSHELAEMMERACRNELVRGKDGQMKPANLDPDGFWRLSEMIGYNETDMYSIDD